MPWDQTCTMQFYFGAGLQRLISVKYKGLLKTQTLSLGGYEIRETTRGSLGTLVEKEVRSSFGNGAKVKRWTALNPVIPIIAYEYGVSDRLGSDSVTYTGEGQDQSQRGHLKAGETQKSERQSYDAWCARRNADTWAPAKGPLGESNPAEEREGSNLARGYTGHEMLDDVGLVHMNGRLYDPSLGRMCGADPYVQTPENLQNYNRYSYVLNNPLSQIDPSGHIIIGLIAALVTAIVGIIGGIIATVVAFVAYLAALAAQFVLTVVGLNGAAAAMGSMGASCLAAAKAGVALVSSYVTGAAFGLKGTLLGKMIGGAALSSIYNSAQTAINGGSFSDVLKSAAIGAATGAVGAAVGGALAGIPGNVAGSLTPAGAAPSAAAIVAGKVVHAAAHGVAAGLMSMAMGGTFKDGFIGSAIGAGVSHVTGFALGEEVMDDIGIIGRTAVAAISGGAASALAGEKFTDGAFSAAFFHLFNGETSRGKLKADYYIKDKVLVFSDPTAGDLMVWGMESGAPTTINNQVDSSGPDYTNDPDFQHVSSPDMKNGPAGPIPEGKYKIVSHYRDSAEKGGFLRYKLERLPGGNAFKFGRGGPGGPFVIHHRTGIGCIVSGGTGSEHVERMQQIENYMANVPRSAGTYGILTVHRALPRAVLLEPPPSNGNFGSRNGGFFSRLFRR